MDKMELPGHKSIATCTSRGTITPVSHHTGPDMCICDFIFKEYSSLGSGWHSTHGHMGQLHSVFKWSSSTLSFLLTYSWWTAHGGSVSLCVLALMWGTELNSWVIDFVLAQVMYLSVFSVKKKLQMEDLYFFLLLYLSYRTNKDTFPGQKLCELLSFCFHSLYIYWNILLRQKMFKNIKVML